MPEFAAGLVPQPWQEVNGGVGFQNSWADSGSSDPCAFRLVPAMNAVEIRGDLTAPTFSTDSVIFTLPTTLQPAAIQSFFIGVITSTGTVGVKTPRGYVPSNGNVTVANASIPGASSGLTTRIWFTAYISLDF